MKARKTAAKKGRAKPSLAISFLSSGSPESHQARDRLIALYGDCRPEDAEVIVALGGDGLMLQTLHRTMEAPKPIYGMNRGSVGFLMNEYSDRDLPKRLAAARPSIIHPLLMRADRHQGRAYDRARDQRSLDAQAGLAGGQAPDQRRRRGAARRIDRRRHSRRDPRRFDGLQPLGQRPDPAARTRR